MVKNKKYKHELFPAIEKKLHEIAKQRDKSIIEIIEQFKIDIENFKSEGYQKNINEINIQQISDKMRGVLIEFLDILINEQREEEKKMEQQKIKETTKQSNEAKWNEVIKTIDDIMSSEKRSSRLECILVVMEKIRLDASDIEFTRKEKRYVLKKLEEMEEEEIKREQDKAIEIKKQNEANKIWEEISEKVRNESENGEKPQVQYWIAIREMLFGEEEGKIRKDLKISKGIKNKVKKMLDDEIYYQDVKYYTEDFKFLRDFPEVALGSSPRRGFSDIKSSLKYDDLRVKLQASFDEYQKIKTLLNFEKDDVTIRILEERKKEMEKQRERREREGRDR